MKRKKKAPRLRTEPKKSKNLRDVMRAMSRRQLGAIGAPVPVGTEVGPAAGAGAVQNVAGSEFRVRLVFVMAGSPELLGPCWMAEVTLHRAGRPELVSLWSSGEQTVAKGLVMSCIKGVGHGDNFDVQMGAAELRIWRMARVIEAQIAEARLAGLAQAIAGAEATMMIVDDPAKLPRLDIVCDHNGGDEYHCDKCKPSASDAESVE